MYLIESKAKLWLLIDNVNASFVYIPLDILVLQDYVRISDHYQTALNWIFKMPLFSRNATVFYQYKYFRLRKYEAVIIFEDDLELAPDIFEYFTATFSLLKNDPTLYCVSAWNDHGLESHVNMSAPEQLYRY